MLGNLFAVKIYGLFVVLLVKRSSFISVCVKSGRTKVGGAGTAVNKIWIEALKSQRFVTISFGLPTTSGARRKHEEAKLFSHCPSTFFRYLQLYSWIMELAVGLTPAHPNAEQLPLWEIFLPEWTSNGCSRFSFRWFVWTKSVKASVILGI